MNARFIDLLHGAAELCGLTPGVTLSSEAASELARHLTRAIREAKRMMVWPQLLVTEERAYRPAYDSGETYAEGDVVYDSGTDAYYESLVDLNAGNAVTDTDFWEVAADLAQYVDMEADGETPMEAVIGVYDEDPRGRLRGQKSRDFRISGRTAIVGSSAGTTVWVEFRRVLDKVTTDAWAAETTYVRGELVYVEDDGDCYLVIVDGVDGDYPPTSIDGNAENPTWARVEIPEEWAAYLEQRAAAYYYFGDGARETAGQLEADALISINTAMADMAHNQRQTASNAA